MTPRNIFKVVVATVGLLGVAYGTLTLFDGLLGTLGLFEDRNTSPKYYGARGAIQIVLGLLLMRGVAAVTNFVFPDDRER